MREIERVRKRDKSKQKSKNTTLGGQLGNYKGSKKDALVSVNSVIQGLKRDWRTTLRLRD